MENSEQNMKFWVLQNLFANFTFSKLKNIKFYSQILQSGKLHILPKKIYKLQKLSQNEKFSEMQNPSHAQWVAERVAQWVAAYMLPKIFLLKQGTVNPSEAVLREGW